MTVQKVSSMCVCVCVCVCVCACACARVHATHVRAILVWLHFVSNLVAGDVLITIGKENFRKHDPANLVRIAFKLQVC